MLQVEALSKSYGALLAVSDVSFQVRPGEVYGFLGVNGAGKTTTLKVCAGLLRPNAGVVRLGGYNLTEEPIKAKEGLGYVPENPFLHGKLTGYEFLQLIARVYRLTDTARMQKTIKELVERLEMGEAMGKLTETYSLGMRRKLVLMGALCSEPKVLLLDEPTSGLDASSAFQAKELFSEAAARGVAVLITTHIMEIAEKLCGRFGVIHEGQLVAEGTLEQLQEKTGGHSLEEAFLSITGRR